MKTCLNCGRTIADESTFCGFCGMQCPSPQNFNQNPVPNGSSVNYDPYIAQQNFQPQQPYAQVYQLSPQQMLGKRLTVSMVMYIIGAALQGLYLIYTIINRISVLENSFYYARYYPGIFIGIVLGFLFLAIGLASNITFAIMISNLKNRTLTYPKGVVAKYRSPALCVVMLVIGILFGGLFGILGSSFNFSARSIVKNNYSYFMQLENQVFQSETIR